MFHPPLTHENALKQLFITDRNYCQDKYESYWKQIERELQKSRELMLTIDSLQATKNQTHTPAIQALEKNIKESVLNMDLFTRVLIEAIEEYFRTRYNLEFTSFNENNPDIGLLEPLATHRPIIHNILKQAGQKYATFFFN